MKSLGCPNKACPPASAGSIIYYGLYNTNSGTPSIRVPKLREDILREHRHTLPSLQHRRATFDEVAALSVEGLNKSAIARVKQIAWNTVARWPEKAAHSYPFSSSSTVAFSCATRLAAGALATR